jgi:hypothetical protein
VGAAHFPRATDSEHAEVSKPILQVRDLKTFFFARRGVGEEVDGATSTSQRRRRRGTARPGSVFRHVDWSFNASVRPGDEITAEVEVPEKREDKANEYPPNDHHESGRRRSTAPRSFGSSPYEQTPSSEPGVAPGMLALALVSSMTPSFSASEVIPRYKIVTPVEQLSRAADDRGPARLRGDPTRVERAQPRLIAPGLIIPGRSIGAAAANGVLKCRRRRQPRHPAAVRHRLFPRLRLPAGPEADVNVLL